MDEECAPDEELGWALEDEAELLERALDELELEWDAEDDAALLEWTLEELAELLVCTVEELAWVELGTTADEAELLG